MIVFMLDTFLLDLIKKYFIDIIREDPDNAEVSLKLYSEKQGTYEEEKERMKKSGGLISYDILKNDEYSDLYHSIIEFLDTRAKNRIKKEVTEED